VPYLQCLGWNFLWYDAKVKPVAPDNLPLNHYFPNQGLVILRTGWQKSDLVFSFTSAPVGGHNAYKAALEGNKKMLSNYGHLHAMVNSFDLYAYGTYLAVPPSYGPIESNFQNTLTIEGANQQRSPKFDAGLLNVELKKDYSYMVGDATQCYPSSINLTRWYRHVVFFPPNTFIIGDELIASQASSTNKLTSWHMNFNPEWTSAAIDSINQIVRIKGKSALQADLLYPLKMTFETKKVGAFARQVNASVIDIFSSGKEQQILAVLSALENPDSKALEAFLINEKAADPLRFPDLSLAVIKLLGPGEYISELPGETAPGHFGLAVRDYTHSTAPNRRYTDLITQRLLKAAIEQKPSPYTNDELDVLAKHCTETEDAARKVERQVGKSAAALLLESRIGEQFESIVTGASSKGTWVRLVKTPVEGRLVHGLDGIDVGDRIRVELISVDVERGYIDFGKVGPSRNRCCS